MSFKHFATGLLFITFFSCKKDIHYSFKLINKTDYNLDLIEFDFGFTDQDGHTESLKARKTSDLIVLNFTGAEIFAPGFLDISIRDYSKNDSTFTNTCGTQMVRSKFIEDGLINYIEIKLDTSQNPDSETFCRFDISSRE